MKYEKAFVGRLLKLLLVIGILLTFSGCYVPMGSIVILENPNATGFTMDIKERSAKNKGELSLRSGDVLQIEVVREEGEVALTVSGKKGSQPYTGNHLETGVFTITVSETDVYLVQITGKNATVKVTVKNVGRGAK